MRKFTSLVALTVLAACIAGPWSTGVYAQSTGRTSTVGKAKLSAGDSASTSTRTSSAPKTTPKVATVPAGAPSKQKAKNPQQQNQQRALPAAQPYRIPKLDPEMEAILAEWEEKSSQIQRLEGTFTRTTYNGVFGVEQLASGKYCFEYPDKGSFEQKGVSPRVEGQKGAKYVQKAGQPERWICDGINITRIDDAKKEFERIQIPEGDRGENIRNSPLPFLFGMKAAEAKQRYRFVLNTEKTNERYVILKVYPLTKQDLYNYVMAEVQLDRATFIPMAVKLHNDDSGDKQDLYMFAQKGMIINKQSWSYWLRGDPLKPSLAGYKQAVAPSDDVTAKPGTQLAPRPTDRRSTQALPSGNKTFSSKTAPQRTAQLPEDDDLPARASKKGTSRP